MAGLFNGGSLSLRCGDCGGLLKSVEEAQEHAELTSHSNFVKSTEAVLNLVCNSCGNPCRSRIADLLLSCFRFSPSAKLDSEMEETGGRPRCDSIVPIPLPKKPIIDFNTTSI